MSTGQEEPTAAPPKNVPGCHDHGVEEERDRFQEGGADSTESGNIQLLVLWLRRQRIFFSIWCTGPTLLD